MVMFLASADLRREGGSCLATYDNLMNETFRGVIIPLVVVHQPPDIVYLRIICEIEAAKAYPSPVDPQDTERAV